MPVYYKNRTRGFGLRTVKPEVSPYAIQCFGEPASATVRTGLSSDLIRADVMQMGLNTINIKDPIFKQVVREAFTAFQIERVSPYHLADVMNMELDCRTSSAGIPWQPTFRTRGEVMDNPEARESILTFWRRVKKGDAVSPPDCRVLYRAHLNKDGVEPKLRAVYGYGTTITLMEACFALPLIEGYKKSVTPIAYGYDMAVGGAMRLRKDLQGYTEFSCFDFSSFDKTVSAQLIDIAFDVLSYNLDLSRYRNFGTPNATEQLRVFNYVKDYFINTPLRMHDGTRYIKKGGVPSGSYFTQLVDSVVNWIVLNYAIRKTHGNVKFGIKVFGDDSVIYTKSHIVVDAVCSVVEEAGMKINKAKSLQSHNINDVEFLGFRLIDGFPFRKTKKWLEAVYHPEWPDECWDDFASRILGLFYANCGVNRDFSDMCRRVLEIRPFKIKFTRDMQRMLRILGIQDTSTSLPTDDQLMMRLLD